MYTRVKLELVIKIALFRNTELGTIARGRLELGRLDSFEITFEVDWGVACISQRMGE